MKPFTYHAPTTVDEAVAMLESLGLPEEDLEKIKWKNALNLFW